jgi:hypothetical protein
LVPLDSVPPTLLGLRYLFLVLPLTVVVPTVVEAVVAVLPFSLYLEIEPELVETFSGLDFDDNVGVVYLLTPLLRDLFFSAETSVRAESV